MINGHQAENVGNNISYLFSNKSTNAIEINENEIAIVKLDLFTAVPVFRVMFKSNEDLDATVQIDDLEEIVKSNGLISVIQFKLKLITTLFQSL